MQEPIETKKAAQSPQLTLIDINIRWLRQALTLLNAIDDSRYSTPPVGFAPHRVGAHLRHILEFYISFIDGLESRHIDYDARRRDMAIENSRPVASALIRKLIQFFETSGSLRTESSICVRMEDADASNCREHFMKSSISRELQVLSSHTIHHFALTAMTLRAHGVEVDPEFGVAPSTLRYLASKAATRAKAA
jgi:hypothetical protein